MKFLRSTVLLLVIFSGAGAFAQEPGKMSQESGTINQVGPERPSPVLPNDSKSTLGYNVLLETKEERFNVGLFGQFSSFERAGIKFIGNPFEVLAGYALTEKIGFNINLMQAIDLSDGASILYSGLRTSASYNFIGENFSRRSTVLVNGAPSISITPFLEPTLSADFGFDQIFFNGKTRVAPATGMSFGAQYARMVSTYRLAVMARYGQLKVSDDSVNLMTAGVGLLYRF